MPRVTLYVGDDLKARMDEVGEGVNWSGVAQRAFREAISIHSVRADDSRMEEVIERLKASKERYEDREFEFGKKKGAEWAKAEAEYYELSEVATFYVYPITYGFKRRTLEELIDPEGVIDEREWTEFWEKRYGRGTPSSSFIRGFMEGAAEIFYEVADRL